MSLNLLIKNGNISRDSDDNLVFSNTSIALAVKGTSRDTYTCVRTIAYAQSGGTGAILRFNENSNGSRQYYQFRYSPEGDWASIEEINHSKAYSAPTIIQSKLFTTGVNESHYLTFMVTALNESQDSLRGLIDDMVVCEYNGTLNLSSGQQGLMNSSGISRFDRFSIVGKEIDYYCTPGDVKQLLKGIGVSSITDEGELMLLISRASFDINDYTSAVFGRLAKVDNERHTGHGEESLIVDHTPIKMLSRIDLYNYAGSLVNSLIPGDGTFDNLIIEEDTGEITMLPRPTTLTTIYGVGLYPVDGMNNNTFREYDYSQYFGGGRRNIIVSYMYGTDDIPRHVWDACRKTVGIEMLIKIGNHNTRGAAMIRLGDAMEDYRVRGDANSGSLPFIGTILQWQKDIKLALEEYDSILVEGV